MSTYQVYIPTWNRLGKAPLIEAMDPAEAIIIARPSEADYYRLMGWRVHELPDDAIGLGAAREDLMQNATEDYIWFLDDDIHIPNRKQVIEYITYQAEQQKAAMFGIGEHFMRNRRWEKDGEFSRQGSTNRAWGLHRKSYLNSGLDMWGWVILEDLYCWLGMQIAGFRVMIYNGDVRLRTSEIPGGCKDDQFIERIMEYSQRLCHEFHPYIEIVDSDRGSIQNIKFGKAFRRRWKKIHDEIPRRDPIE